MWGEGLGSGAAFRPTNQPEGNRGADERKGVQQDGHGRGDQLHQKAGEAGTGDIGDGLGERQLAVGFDDVFHVTSDGT